MPPSALSKPNGAFLAKPFKQHGVWVTWAKKLAEMIAAPGTLSLTEVANIAERLASALPPAVKPKSAGATPPFAERSADVASFVPDELSPIVGMPWGRVLATTVRRYRSRTRSR